jgi:hypothetical protein
MTYHTIKASGVKSTSAAYFLVVNFEDWAICTCALRENIRVICGGNTP